MSSAQPQLYASAIEFRVAGACGTGSPAALCVAIPISAAPFFSATPTRPSCTKTGRLRTEDGLLILQILAARTSNEIYAWPCVDLPVRASTRYDARRTVNSERTRGPCGVQPWRFGMLAGAAVQRRQA